MGVLIGRGHELAEIERALAAAQDGHGRLVLIGGPGGIGKTVVADAAAEAARRRGMQVARAYAVDDPGAPAMWPWLRLIRDWPGADALPGPEAGEPDAAARFRLFVAVTDLLLTRAESGGMAVILEDLHWADRTSILLLRHVVAELAATRLAIVATYRDVATGPLGDSLPHLLRGEVARPISLDGLGPDDVARWLPQLTGASDVALASVLHDRTGGNPLLIRLVAEDIASRAGTDDAALIDRLMEARPQLRRLVAAKVAPLEAGVRQLIDAASVLGERIDVALLAAVTDHSVAQIQTQLEIARTTGVLRDGGADGLLFEHALVRDAVYGELSPSRRAELHRAAASALETRGDDTAAGSIAAHWERVDDADAVRRCLHWAEVADERARASLAHDDAARFAELAVACARRVGVPDEELARLLIRLAEAQFLANFFEKSVTACVEAADLADAVGRPELLAAAGLVIHGMGSPLVQQAIPAICERALRTLAPEDHVTRSRLLSQIAVGAAESEGGSRCAELAAEALAEAERSEDPTAILEAISARHLAISVPDTVVERLELGRRAVDLGATARQPIAALWGHLWRTDAAFQLGNLTEVERELGEIDRVAQRQGSALARWHRHRYDASRAALIGDFPAARLADAAATALAMRVGDLSLAGMTVAFCGQLAVVRGYVAELPPWWEDVYAHAPNMPLVRISQPTMHAVAGELELARAEFEEFRHLPASFPFGVRWAPTLAQIGVTAVLLDDAEVAAAVFHKLAPTARYYSGDGSGAVFSHGANPRLLGDLARVAGLHDEALSLYRDAVAMNARIGARPFTALSRLGWAQTLATTQDLAAAAELCAQAAAEFRRLDMPGPLAAALAFTSRLETARRTASPLSARESEVAALVAQALSNREIANRLVLSERTVEAHVRSILAKLGYATRTQIAAWVLRSRT